ncbi:MAG: hypothetical protein LBP79_00670 [Clostridiales bacterium]|jgi:UDP-N-acetylmuramoylalanine--D-glutamate ligase|nr:hypothetical protein [Clostridiales bacterium]
MSENILIVGFKRSGVAVAELMRRLGKNVYVYDRAGIAEPPEYAEEDRSGKKDFGAVLDGINTAVISPSVGLDSGIVSECKKRGVEVIGEIEAAFRAFQGNITAVTGTNGKTTTVMLIEDIYKRAGKKCAALGNIGKPFSEFFKSDTDEAVLEVSSFQLESVKKFRPHIAVFLNFAPDHLDRHKNAGEYFAAKMKIFENQTADDYAVINYDDGTLRGFFCGENNSGKKVEEHCAEPVNLPCFCAEKTDVKRSEKHGVEPANLPYISTEKTDKKRSEKCGVIRSKSLYFSAEKRVRGAYAEDGEIFFDDGEKREKICRVSDLKISGRHNLENALAAVCAAKLNGVENEYIIAAFQNFKLAHNRIEFVREIGSTRFFNDSKGTNIHATAAAVRSMTGSTALILGGSDKGEDFADLFSALPDNISAVFVTGQNATAILSAAEKFPHIRTERIDSLKEGVDAAYAKRPENVLFSPASASFDRYRNYEERGQVFVGLVNELTE